jgi:hypothetical protein
MVYYTVEAHYSCGLYRLVVTLAYQSYQVAVGSLPTYEN